MIVPAASTTADAVARHYDELDVFYREIWGEHVHHGLWLTGAERAERAVTQLIERVAERARIRAGSSVCDVGCGYGATARLLAERFGALVTAISIAPRQIEYACSRTPKSQNPAYVLGDWLNNDFPTASFDAVIAIESTEHMNDKQRAFDEMARVLKPGGRLVVCAWLANENAKPWQIRHLLEPICSEGRLPGMATEVEYREFIRRAGFIVDNFEDLSGKVQRTWSICIRRLFVGCLRRPEWRRFLLTAASANRVFALTIFRIWLAYVTGAMRYGLFTAHHK
jgi:tocopherol O-methyltransferase